MVERQLSLAGFRQASCQNHYLQISRKGRCFPVPSLRRIRQRGRTVSVRLVLQESLICSAETFLYRTYPRLTLRLRAPVEIENLLPFDIRFRIYDKNREHNWSSFLRKGGTSPLHMAELSHLLLLSVEIQDSREMTRQTRCTRKTDHVLHAAFKRSEFAIINTDNPDDLPIEHHTPVTDNSDIKLNLQLFYMYVFNLTLSYPS